jgi:predicted deacetylase
LSPERLDWDRHLLVIANETVAGAPLIEAVKRHKAEEPLHVTVICPVNPPREGYVVYQDTRRAAAGRRLDKTLTSLREEGILAQGFVVETDPVNAVRDALAQLEPPVTQIVVSTHPQRASSWLRRNVVDKIRDAARDLPVEHVVVDLEAEKGPANVLVLANETVVGAPLLQKVKKRADRGPASFLIVCPQSDPHAAEHPEAERRLRRALSELRSAGIDAHGQIAHPDPFTAAMQAIEDERIDEIIVSTFPQARSGWLRRDLIERLRQETGKPVQHVVTEAEPAEITS